jgi:hypothetical protein
VAIAEGTPMGSIKALGSSIASVARNPYSSPQIRDDYAIPTRSQSSRIEQSDHHHHHQAPLDESQQRTVAVQSSPLLDRKILRKSLPSSTFQQLRSDFANSSLKITRMPKGARARKTAARTERQLAGAEPFQVGGFELSRHDFHSEPASPVLPGAGGEYRTSPDRSTPSSKPSRSSSADSHRITEANAHPLIVGRHYVPLHQPPPEINPPGKHTHTYSLSLSLSLSLYL